jgi:hypothetical protein
VPLPANRMQEEGQSAFRMDRIPRDAAEALESFFQQDKFPLHAGFLTPE